MDDAEKQEFLKIAKRARVEFVYEYAVLALGMLAWKSVRGSSDAPKHDVADRVAL
jgi:hypothetical protein